MEARTDDRAATARHLITLLDLTSPGASDKDSDIEDLCRRAVTPFGAIAAVCIRSRHVGVAKRMLAGTGVRVCAVAKVPDGRSDMHAAARDVRDALAGRFRIGASALLDDLLAKAEAS